jgi:ATP-dependent DNA helicase DinG
MSVAAWLGPNGRFRATLPGYESRPGQLQMALAIEQALAHDGTLLVEAGTGTGKTLAYLLPAIESGKRVVVSTGTKTLQDQIMRHDLPLLEAQLGRPIAAACMKGLSNYLCLRRYEEFRRSPAAVSDRAARHVPRLELWRERTHSGDQEEFASQIDDAELWAEVQSGSDTRVGPKCAHYEPCFVTRMRRQAESAKLIIVNHHLFFADLALRGQSGHGGVLPEHDAVIFDEAHLIEDIATDFFGVSVSTNKIEVFVRDAARCLAAVGLAARADRSLAVVALSAARLFQEIPRPKLGDGGRTPLLPEHVVTRLQEPLFALDNALDAIASIARTEAARGEAVAQLARRAQLLRDQLAFVAETGPGKHVAWTLARGRSSSLGVSPIEIGPMLREHLFLRGGALVLTSATLSTSGSYDYVKTRLGIDFEVDELNLPTPFDYANQAALYLPTGLGDPRDPGFIERASAEIAELVEITGGGAFVLCTSLRVMNELAERCRVLLPYRSFVQGEASNAALLESFRSDGNAVLFATSSFWQGVDVPGAALRLVIIDKLPFDVPADPLIQARCQSLKQRGIEPFMKYLVPSASLVLKQGFGRLIRTQRDRGIVALLDGRVSSKGYGKVFLRSLPEARRCRSLAEVRGFWDEVIGEQAG